MGNVNLRIVLSNIGTFGDINPLIAIALELKRRGHAPVMALPNVYRPKIEPLGLEFHAIRPDIDPTDTRLAAMIYDVKRVRRRGCASFCFPCSAKPTTTCSTPQPSLSAPTCCCWAN